MHRHFPALLRQALLGAALLVLGGACAAEPVRLWKLREAEPGTGQRLAYERLELAADLANEFLETSEFARGFPAEGARFSLDHSDVLVRFTGEGIWPLRIESAGWADLRTAVGDGIHPNERGFLAARRTDRYASGDATEDSAFLLLDPPAMAGLLLRQAATMREIHARGSFDYWLNYDLLGTNPHYGWRDSNPVDARANAVHEAFWQWYEARAESEGSAVAEPASR
ncbi:MAG: hypothetical protein O3A20_05020 [Planctomycetota bacterium]|nr:hypothetical protein [Planctomycetota bacterium]